MPEELEERNLRGKEGAAHAATKDEGRNLRVVCAAALAASGWRSSAGGAEAATEPKAPPAGALGIWTGAEDGGSYSAVAGQHPDIANYYLAWGQQWPAQFISRAEAAGATPYIEIEPWHAGRGWDQTPSFTAIVGSADSADTHCNLDGSSYDTSCAAWLAGIGQAVGQLVGFIVQTEFGTTEAAGGCVQVGVDLGDGGLAARPRAAGQFAGLRGRVGGCIPGRTHLHHLGVARRLPAALSTLPACSSLMARDGWPGCPLGGSTSSATFRPMRSYFWARRIDLMSVLFIFTSDALLSTLAMSRKKRSASVALKSLRFVAPIAG